jgi:hypothetical protein
MARSEDQLKRIPGSWDPIFPFNRFRNGEFSSNITFSSLAEMISTPEGASDDTFRFLDPVFAFVMAGILVCEQSATTS